jgi:preprotein translocase subunit SecG
MLLVFQILQMLAAIITISLVLLHSAKGEGLGSIGSSAQMFTGSSELEKGLNVITWIGGLTFMFTSALISWGIIK